MPSELDLLHEQLEEKDELVFALTARLEQAAEQLDRLHRLGVDKALLNYATTPAPPVRKKTSKQEPLHEDLERLIEQWDALQANNSFGRIEIQIGEVRDLIVQLSQTVREQQVIVPQAPPMPQPTEMAPPPSAPGAHPDFEDGAVDLPDNLFQEGAPTEQVEPPPPTITDYSNWDSIKQTLMGESAEPAQSAPQSMEGSAPAAANEPAASIDSGTPIDPAAMTDAASKEAEEAAFLAHLADLVPEGLRDVDLDNASHNEIAKALEERDEYISRLLNYITAVHKLDMNWDIISQGPAALQERLKNLQSQLEAKLRLAEVSIAVERAKLGRDEMRIRQLESNAERVLKRLGVDPSDPNSINKIEKGDGNVPQGSSSEAAAGGNWRRLLGLGKDDETE